jgi:hypothetical protein
MTFDIVDGFWCYSSSGLDWSRTGKHSLAGLKLSSVRMDILRKETHGESFDARIRAECEMASYGFHTINYML